MKQGFPQWTLAFNSSVQTLELFNGVTVTKQSSIRVVIAQPVSKLHNSLTVDYTRYSQRRLTPVVRRFWKKLTVDVRGDQEPIIQHRRPHGLIIIPLEALKSELRKRGGGRIIVLCVFVVAFRGATGSRPLGCVKRQPGYISLPTTVCAMLVFPQGNQDSLLKRNKYYLIRSAYEFFQAITGNS